MSNTEKSFISSSGDEQVFDYWGPNSKYTRHISDSSNFPPAIPTSAISERNYPKRDPDRHGWRTEPFFGPEHQEFLDDDDDDDVDVEVTDDPTQPRYKRKKRGTKDTTTSELSDAERSERAQAYSTIGPVRSTTTTEDEKTQEEKTENEKTESEMELPPDTMPPTTKDTTQSETTTTTRTTSIPCTVTVTPIYP